MLVEPWALHGDSGLVGRYIMAMTGNHEAMGTADTVYIKNRNSHNNVKITINEKNEEYVSRDLLLTSNILSLNDIKYQDKILKTEIYNTVEFFRSLWWQPVILTPNNYAGWDKTIGLTLPN